MIKISDADLHPHLKIRMLQRGVTLEEIGIVLNEGWDAKDAKSGTLGKVYVFRYNGQWEGYQYEEKEVSVYYRKFDNEILILTTKARYGKEFPRERVGE